MWMDGSAPTGPELLAARFGLCPGVAGFLFFDALCGLAPLSGFVRADLVEGFGLRLVDMACTQGFYVAPL
jgi:hypothetical protein